MLRPRLPSYAKLNTVGFHPALFVWRIVAHVTSDKPLFVHRQSAYLFGRERKVADIPIDHPSCSGQHAVLQYRQVELPGKGDDVTTRLVVR